MLISVPQITGDPGFVEFSGKVYIQYLYLYIGLDDKIQTPDLNQTLPQYGRCYAALGVSRSPVRLHSNAVGLLACI